MDPGEPGEVIGNSAPMREVLKLIGLAAASNVTILLTGETGSGKEVSARLLHRASERANAPLVAVNCAAIPAELLESELFGHAKGAFTGAIADRPGRFRQARGGTLLLDEIGDMPLTMQAKVLRVLEERRFTPVGSAREETADVRLVAATHRELGSQVREGLFREDLLSPAERIADPRAVVAGEAGRYPGSGASFPGRFFELRQAFLCRCIGVVMRLSLAWKRAGIAERD